MGYASGRLPSRGPLNEHSLIRMNNGSNLRSRVFGMKRRPHHTGEDGHANAGRGLVAMNPRYGRSLCFLLGRSHFIWTYLSLHSVFVIAIRARLTRLSGLNIQYMLISNAEIVCPWCTPQLFSVHTYLASTK